MTSAHHSAYHLFQPNKGIRKKGIRWMKTGLVWGNWPDAFKNLVCQGRQPALAKRPKFTFDPQQRSSKTAESVDSSLFPMASCLPKTHWRHLILSCFHIRIRNGLTVRQPQRTYFKASDLYTSVTDRTPGKGKKSQTFLR
jgi:hypothetical protein